jgi:hypothetical protein
MKCLTLLAALGLATATALPLSAKNLTATAIAKDDTILVKLANGAKMNLIVKNTEQLKSFQNYSLDSLMIMLNKYIAEADKKKDMTGKDYTVTFHPAEETKSSSAPEKINITIKGEETNGKGEAKVTKIKIDVDYEGDNKEKPTFKSKLIEADSLKQVKKNSRSNSGINFELGFNTLLNTGNNILDVAGLETWGSRYIGLNPYYTFRIGGTKSPLKLRTGFNFAFNNYMFDRNYVLKETETSGFNYTILEKDPRKLDKSKLATTTVNLPLMAILDFKNQKGRSVFRFGAGGFAGYRLGSHTKIKFSDEGKTEKIKDPGSFNLEDFQYGVNALIGFYGIDLFANYNLNELFKDGHGPKANVLSFGIKI